MKKINDDDVFVWLAEESKLHPEIDFERIKGMASQDRDVRRLSRVVTKRSSKFKPILSTRS